MDGSVCEFPVGGDVFAGGAPKLGSGLAQLWDFRAGAPETVVMGASSVLLVRVLDGEVRASGPTTETTIGSGEAVLFARAEPIGLEAGEAARALVLRLSRPRLQRLASRDHGDGRRLSTAAPWPLRGVAGDDLAKVFVDLERAAAAQVIAIPAVYSALDERLHEAVVAALGRAGPVDQVLPTVRSVSHAMRQVQQQPDADWDLDRLAAAVGVTPPSLQRAFHLHLGKGVSAFILDVRLGRARESLGSAHDSRPISAIAESLGFSKPGSFSRAYTRAFGETPSETRAMAVRSYGIGVTKER